MQALHCLPTPTQDGIARLHVQGSLNRHSVGQLLKAIRGLSLSKNQQLILHLNALSEIDSAGVACLFHIWQVHQKKGISVSLDEIPPSIQEQLSLFRIHPQKAAEKKGGPSIFERAGDAALKGLDNALALLVLASDTSAELVTSLVKPKRIRWPALVEQMSHIGSQGLGTVSLITFLVGLTLAFQSAHQLRQFGAAIFVADLTAVAMMREMGPLMTAILVAGRSGSAIAAEIATMKVSEELDALEVMGISFNQFLATPRVLAMLIVMPLLVIMADLIGIGGGLVVGLGYLDLSLGPYLSQTLDALGSKDLIMSLSKAMVFGWGIALIGLHNGLQVREGAQEVGTATTSSVVQSLFFIIIMDALFSILFYVVL